VRDVTNESALPLDAGRLPATRRRRWGPVRLQLTIVALLPAIGLLAASVFVVHSSFSIVFDAGRAQTLAEMSSATAQLLHELGREQAETIALQERGGSSGQLLVTAQRARTDGALDAYQIAAKKAASTAPAMSAVLNGAQSLLGRLSGVRRDAGGGLAAPYPYQPLMTALVAVSDAVPAQLIGRDLANRTQAIANLVAAKQALAEQRDLLRSAFSRHSLAAPEKLALAQLVAVEQQRILAFQLKADSGGWETFKRLMSGADVDTTRQVRDRALAGDGAALTQDSDGWYVVSSYALRQLHEVELVLIDELAQSAGTARGDALRDAVVTVILASILATGTAAVAVALATRTSRRIRRLEAAALATATGLASAIAEITAADDPASTRDSHLARRAKTNNVSIGSRDEIGQVASALTVVHATAVNLAAGQALMRLDVELLVAALARRSQELVLKQLRAIDELEDRELDPDVLAKYYAVDHLATRMLRNDENLLVLVGAQSGRKLNRPYPLFDVVRAASAEIADYARIDIADMPLVGIAAHAVGDLVHLLAEFLENSTTFSAQDTRVTVTGHRTIDGLRIVVYDNGVGMTPVAMADANRRLAQPSSLTSALAHTLGLLVVARLAAHHGIRAELRSRERMGTASVIAIPENLLVDPPSPAVAPLTTSAWRRVANGASIGT
jgi:Nitrate and nitrite sensing/Histidine kinase-, DNA gyrase B-, and HSP90-like ATPase